MRLVDLDPRWVGAGGEGISNRNPETGELTPAPKRHGVAVSFRCPCGTHPRDDEYETDRCVILFNNPLDGGGPFDEQSKTNHYWLRTGETFETLTLHPSIQRVGGCAWHGHLVNGVFIPC